MAKNKRGAFNGTRRDRVRSRGIICIALAAAALAALMAACTSGAGGDPKRTAEPAANGQKAKKQLEGYLKNAETFPLSFAYDGKSQHGLGKGFVPNGISQKEENDGTRYEAIFTHEASGAVFRIDAKAYNNFNALEWTVYISNDGGNATGVFSDILACDLTVTGRDPVLKGINGDLGDMYMPYEVPLSNGGQTKVHKESVSGRPTHGVFPYFNLEYGNGGSFVAYGWPGCWKADFEAVDGTKTPSVRISGGQLSIATRLEPGESIRTPLVAMLNYSGRDEEVNMNLWRRWFIECNMKKDTSGNVIEPAFSWGNVVQGMNTQKLLRTVNSYFAHGVELDYFWIDAGWYTNAAGATCSWPETGTWQVNTAMFPDKFTQVSDLMHEKGGKTLLWFEPEVVRLDKKAFLRANSDFDESWMLGTAAQGTWLEGQLLDLGNPDLRAWLLGRIFTVLDEGRIDMFRQDFNVDPAPVWKQCEGEGRVGFTENNYVQGYLAFWDAILERYPEMTIDSCASGGGRNDLETMRRSVPLHVSDFWDGNAGGYDERQAVMMSLARWFPFFKLGTSETADLTEYKLRCCLAGWTVVNVSSISKVTPWDTIAKYEREWRRYASYIYADFYQLTPVSKADNVWRALEYFDPDQDSGTAVCFRAPKCEQSAFTLKLKGLDPDATYTVTDCDGLISVKATGAELMSSGFEVRLDEAGSSALMFFGRE